MNQSEAHQVQTQRMQSAIQDTPTVRLGQRLRQARLSRNLTQSEVAANQFSVSYISAVEPRPDTPLCGARWRSCPNVLAFPLPICCVWTKASPLAWCRAPSSSRRSAMKSRCSCAMRCS